MHTPQNISLLAEMGFNLYATARPIQEQMRDVIEFARTHSEKEMHAELTATIVLFNTEIVSFSLQDDTRRDELIAAVDTLCNLRKNLKANQA